MSRVRDSATGHASLTVPLTALLAFIAVLGVSCPVPADAQQSNRTAPRDDVKNPYQGDPGAVAQGHELFNARCSFCHGTLGRGAKGPCLTCGHFYYRGGSNAQLFATITGGIPGGQMGAFASSLGADDIWKIIAFLRDQTRKDHPEAVQQRPAAAPAPAGASSQHIPPQAGGEGDND